MHQAPITEAARALPLISLDHVPRGLWEWAELKRFNGATWFLAQQLQGSTSAVVPDLISSQHPMPGADNTCRQQKINQRAGLALLPIAALNKQIRAIALAIKPTLWMGLKL